MLSNIHRFAVVSLFLSTVLAMAACTTPARAPAAPATVSAAKPAATAAPTKAAATVAPTKVAATAAPTKAAAAGIKIEVADSSLGKILVGDAGRTLYVFTKDANGNSTCYDNCAKSWPPLLTEGAPQAGNGVGAKLLGATKRKDGKTQVTYKGMPLYYFANDKVAGDVKGEEVGDMWYVVSPAGEMIHKK